MSPIPVVATIREAYSFALSQLGGIIGLTLVPMVALTVMGFFTTQRYYNDFIEYMASNNAAQMGPSMLMMLGYIVAALLLYAVALVAVIQLAQGTRKDAALVHFAFGPLEWRMFRAFFALLGLIVAPCFLIMLAGSAGAMLGGLGKASLAVSGGMMLITLAVLFLGMMPRFLLLLPSIAVNETVPVLRRAWALSSGHYVRLLGILLGCFVPVMLLILVVETLMTGRQAPLTGATEQLRQIEMVMRARAMLPVTYGLGFLVSPLLIGLFAGASVSVWRRLRGEPTVEILA